MRFYYICKKTTSNFSGIKMEPTQSDKKIFAINPDLQKQVSPILTSMVSMLLKKKPQDPVSFPFPLAPPFLESYLNPIAKQS